MLQLRGNPRHTSMAKKMMSIPSVVATSYNLTTSQAPIYRKQTLIQPAQSYASEETITENALLLLSRRLHNLDDPVNHARVRQLLMC